MKIFVHKLLDIIYTQKTKSSKRSWVRMYYSRTQGVCCCKFCNSRIKDNLTSTGNLIRHMKNAHVDVYEAYKSGNRKAIKYYKELIQEINSKNRELGMSSDEDESSPKEKKQRSRIWSYFVKGTDMCVCKICATELKNNKNSTGNLIRHIKLKHQNIYKTLRFEIDAKTISSNVNPETVQDPLAEFPEVSGFKQRSWVWLYFQRNGERCECKICNVKIRIVSGVNFNSTSNLIRHIRRHHYKLYLAHKNKNSEVVDYYKNAVHELDIQCYDEDGNDISNENVKVLGGKNRKYVRSKVWCYFTENSFGTMTCKLCKKIFITDKMTGTSNLLRHLRVKHGFFRTITGNDIKKKDDKEWVWQLVSNEPEEETYKCFMCDKNFDKTLDHEKDLTKIYDHMNSDHGVISAVQIISDEGAMDTSLSNNETKEQDNDSNEMPVQSEIEEEIEIQDPNLEMANIKIIMEETQNHEQES